MATKLNNPPRYLGSDEPNLQFVHADVGREGSALTQMFFEKGVAGDEITFAADEQFFKLPF